METVSRKEFEELKTLVLNQPKTIDPEEFEAFKTLVFNRLEAFKKENSNSRVKIEYNGAWPNMCSGYLKIWLDDELFYEKKYVCESSGSTGFNESFTESFITSGRLTWKKSEAKLWPSYIVDAVNDELSKFEVCCGGCL